MCSHAVVNPTHLVETYWIFTETGTPPKCIDLGALPRAPFMEIINISYDAQYNNTIPQKVPGKCTYFLITSIHLPTTFRGETGKGATLKVWLG